MPNLKLDDLIEFMCDIEPQQVLNVTYYNSYGSVYHGIERVVRFQKSGGPRDYEFQIVFKGMIDFDKFKKIVQEYSDYSVDFFETDESMYVNIGGPFFPVLYLEKNGTVSFRSDRRCSTALKIINGYSNYFEEIYRKRQDEIYEKEKRKRKEEMNKK